MCLRERTVAGKTTEEAHYFIGSGRLGARTVATALRGHWGIENNLHWQLDVHLGEDRSRIQDRNAARNFASCASRPSAFSGNIRPKEHPS